MSNTNNKRRSLNISRETLDSRTISWNSLDSVASGPPTLKDELDNIRESLDKIKSNILSQQFEIARDFEDRVRQTYDGVINDLNEVRRKVNTLGNDVAGDSKFKTWMPTAPFRKDVLHNIYEVRKSSKLTTSKSVDFVDSFKKDKSHAERESKLCQGFVGHGRFSSGKLKMKSSDDLCNKSGLSSSRPSLSSRVSSKISLNRQRSTSGSTSSVSETRSQVPGFGYCFTGDNKTFPYRTYKAKYYTFYRYQRPGHSWGPSRSGSRSTLDDDDWWDEDKGCMCGVVPDDWRMRVAPYMWDGWPVPGLDKTDLDKLRERLKKFDEIRDELVAVQNEYRAMHKCPPLTVTEQLSRDAQNWAEVLAMKGYPQYSDSQSRGENILVIDIEDELSGRQVIDTWYREGRCFNYKRPGWQRGTSNFTQMIWKSTREVGVGIAKFPYADTYVVVSLYKPAGNVNAPGQFRLNVPEPYFDEAGDDLKCTLTQPEESLKQSPRHCRLNLPKPYFNEFDDDYKCTMKEEPEEKLKQTETIFMVKSNKESQQRNTNSVNATKCDEVDNSDISMDEVDENDLHDDKESKVFDDTESDSDGDSVGQSDSDAEVFYDEEGNSDDDNVKLSDNDLNDSTDDILISFDEIQEEMFKEKLVGRKLLGKQIVDEMIRELVNERIEVETQPQEIAEYAAESTPLSQGIVEYRAELTSQPQEIVEYQTKPKQKPQELVEYRTEPKPQPQEIVEFGAELNSHLQGRVDCGAEHKTQPQAKVEYGTEPKPQPQEIVEYGAEPKSHLQGIMEYRAKHKSQPHEIVEYEAELTARPKEIKEYWAEHKPQLQEIVEYRAEPKSIQVELRTKRDQICKDDERIPNLVSKRNESDSSEINPQMNEIVEYDEEPERLQISKKKEIIPLKQNGKNSSWGGLKSDTASPMKDQIHNISSEDAKNELSEANHCQGRKCLNRNYVRRIDSHSDRITDI